jgi:hypothetical protein
MATPESKVKAATTVALLAMKAAGEPIYWFFAVASRYSVAGISDIVGVHRGRFFAFEIKAQNGKATALQLKMQSAVVVAGGIAAVIRPRDDKTIAEQVHEALGYTPK